jgi:hypothetical protein
MSSVDVQGFQLGVKMNGINIKLNRSDRERREPLPLSDNCFPAVLNTDTSSAAWTLKGPEM